MTMVDALRGFAALAVLFFHSLNAFDSPDALHPALRLVRSLTEYGYLGVSIFFVLSGWCIAQRLQTAVRRNESASVFMIERTLRIYPTYWAALLVTLAVRTAAANIRHRAGLADLPAGTTAWLGDLLLLQPYFGTTAYVMVSWSLVYELGFYLLAALALVAHRRAIQSSWLMLAGGLICLWPLSPWQPTALLVLGRWPDFFAGVIAWRAAGDGRAGAIVAGFAALLLLGLMLPGGFASPLRLTSIATASLLLAVVAAGGQSAAAWEFWARIGSFSYSLYLIHVTVLSPFMNLAGRWIVSSSAAFALVWLAALALAVAAGWSLNRWCEAPVERWRKSLFLALTARTTSSP
jgi:peptidoglycan/LPS O-acetylase OafA/YrhL